MRIAEQIVARGTNIEHTAATRRDVFVLAAVTEPGDSGAPVVDQTGKVLGVLFAFDLSRPTTAYALTTQSSTQSSTPCCQRTHHSSVATGPCLSSESATRSAPASARVTPARRADAAKGGSSKNERHKARRTRT